MAGERWVLYWGWVGIGFCMLAEMLVYEPESLILAQSERWRNA